MRKGFERELFELHSDSSSDEEEISDLFEGDNICGDNDFKELRAQLENLRNLKR